MENTEVYIGPEPHIEVHKYYGGVVPLAVLLALVLQAFFPVYFRTRQLSGIAAAGDSLLRAQQAQSVVGVAAGHGGRAAAGQPEPHAARTLRHRENLGGILGSSIGARIDVEHPIARFLLTIGFYLFHHAVFTLTSRGLLAQRSEAYITGADPDCLAGQCSDRDGIVPAAGPVPQALVNSG